jgi:hypothetical protein
MATVACGVIYWMANESESPQAYISADWQFSGRKCCPSPYLGWSEPRYARDHVVLRSPADASSAAPGPSRSIALTAFPSIPWLGFVAQSNDNISRALDAMFSGRKGRAPDTYNGAVHGSFPSKPLAYRNEKPALRVPTRRFYRSGSDLGTKSKPCRRGQASYPGPILITLKRVRSYWRI